MQDRVLDWKVRRGSSRGPRSGRPPQLTPPAAGLECRSLLCWGVVQRQDTWLWTTLLGFESLLPSHPQPIQSEYFTNPHATLRGFSCYRSMVPGSYRGVLFAARSSSSGLPLKVRRHSTPRLSPGTPDARSTPLRPAGLAKVTPLASCGPLLSIVHLPTREPGLAHVRKTPHTVHLKSPPAAARPPAAPLQETAHRLRAQFLPGPAFGYGPPAVFLNTCM